jgi:hypothetical protein
MTQALYAHMNNKEIKIKTNKQKKQMWVFIHKENQYFHFANKMEF